MVQGWNKTVFKVTSSLNHSRILWSRDAEESAEISSKDLLNYKLNHCISLSHHLSPVTISFCLIFLALTGSVLHQSIIP